MIVHQPHQALVSRRRGQDDLGTKLLSRKKPVNNMRKGLLGGREGKNLCSQRTIEEESDDAVCQKNEQKHHFCKKAQKNHFCTKKCAAAGPKTKFNPLVVILLFIDTGTAELRPPRMI